MNFHILTSQLFLVGLAFVSFSHQSLAQTTKLTEIQKQIDEASVIADNFQFSVKTIKTNKKLKFPDYPPAKAKFDEETKKALAQYRLVFSEISQLVNERLGESANNLRAIEKYLAANPNDLGRKEILKIEQERYDQAKVDLQILIDAKYHTALRSLLTLNERLAYPQFRHAAVYSIFSECQYGGCILQMAEHYQAWIRQISVLNQSIDLTEGLGLHALKTLPPARASKKLWKYAENETDLAIIGRLDN
jgi:hypothetical protein